MIAANSPANHVSLCPIANNNRQIQQPRISLRQHHHQQHKFEVFLSVNKSRKLEFVRKIAGDYLLKELKFEGLGGLHGFKSPANAVPDHLVVMVNGLVGSAADWKFAAKQFVEKLPDKVVVHRSKVNYSNLTFDGVDLMGERLAEEVLALVRDRPELQKISFVSHSLGGLVARYAIGRLYGFSEENSSSNLTVNNSRGDPVLQPNEPKIAGLEPLNFITVATPHLGSRGHRQFPILFGLPFLERSASQAAHLIVGKSGKHLFLTDNDDGRPPLLLRMIKDWDDLKFMSALHAFKRRVAYANANYDHMVGWRTSSIRRQHELPESFHLVADKRYPHIVYVEKEIYENSHNKVTSILEDQTTELEEEMIKGLTKVPWERVDVSFETSKQRYIAHSTIQVKNYWFHSDGADVVFHIIDNFLL